MPINRSANGLSWRYVYCLTSIFKAYLAKTTELAYEENRTKYSQKTARSQGLDPRAASRENSA